MENLPDVFGDLASFSLANEFINNDSAGASSLPLSLPFSLSFLKSEYINYIYAGIAVLIIIIGFLIYKFNFVKRKPDDNYKNEDNMQYLNPR